MITKERLSQIGKSIMSNAFTTTGYSSLFNEFRNIKVTIQTRITDRLSQDELYDIALSRKNDDVIKKLITIGKELYIQNPSDEKAYMIAVSITTIIKEYEWESYYMSGDGLYELVNEIAQNTTCLKKHKEASCAMDIMDEEEFDFNENDRFSYSIDVAAEIYKNISTQEEANKMFFEQIELFFKRNGIEFSCSKSNRMPYFDEIIYENDEQTISVLVEKNETKSVKTIAFSTNDVYSVKLFKEGFFNKCLFGLPIFTMQWFDDMNTIFIHFMNRESYLQFDTPQGRIEKDLFGF
ncbi:MAG: hypothetical protein IKW51_06870 [Bacteroidales bacterium]|nr:hypothetical protein [Bacteroidales bacterium]